MTQQCDICTEMCRDSFSRSKKNNNNTAVMIACSNCEFKACTSCIKTYHSNQPSNIIFPKCMKCKVDFDKSISAGLVWFDSPSQFISLARERIKSVALAKEIRDMDESIIEEASLLRELRMYQITLREAIGHSLIIEADISKTRFNNDDKLLFKVRTIKDIIENGSPWLSRVTSGFIFPDPDLEVTKSIAIFEAARQSSYISNPALIKLNYRHRVSKRSRRNVSSSSTLFPCPRNGCRSFIIIIQSSSNEENITAKCSICGESACVKCHDKIIENCHHECNSENVKSIQEIQSHTKPCPTCRTRIYKIEGCSDMFCTECKTCFHWETMAIHKNNSNPHYIEWSNSQSSLIHGRPINTFEGMADRILNSHGGGESSFNACIRIEIAISELKQKAKHDGGQMVSLRNFRKALVSLSRAVYQNFVSIETIYTKSIMHSERVLRFTRVNFTINETSEDVMHITATVIETTRVFFNELAEEVNKVTLSIADLLENELKHGGDDMNTTNILTRVTGKISEIVLKSNEKTRFTFAAFNEIGLCTTFNEPPYIKFINNNNSYSSSPSKPYINIPTLFGTSFNRRKHFNTFLEFECRSNPDLVWKKIIALNVNGVVNKIFTPST